MCVRRERCERVTDREELVGRFSVGSRLPQYLDERCPSVSWTSIWGLRSHLMTAMLTGAVVLARKTVRSPSLTIVRASMSLIK